LIKGIYMSAFFACALGGACLGFLRYNMHPAKIFMGDTGSNFLGFAIASLAIFSSHKAGTAIMLLVPIIGLAIPILDTSLAFFRRLANGESPFNGDKKHIHHLLLKRNLTEKQVVFLLLAVTVCLNVLALLTFFIK
jgi:UDP-GlcNAc:undecaprenyl-phosphate/decaprenyl-phosphate GlcNAc-1-phosphate transferase